MGWLSRTYGLTCDNLLSADVVTAEGAFVRASESENPDLFWALRGGGGVGVVTSFEFQLEEVGPGNLAGSLVYPLEKAAEAARHYRTFVADAPPEVRLLFGSMALPDPDVHPATVRDTRVALIVACYAGSPAAGRRVLNPHRTAGDPVVDSIRERTDRAFQRAGNSRGRMRTYLRSQYLPTASDGAIDTIVEYVRRAPSPAATVFVSPRGGAETDPASDAAADAHHCLVESRWQDADRDGTHVEWTLAFHDALRPHANGAVAVNLLTGDELDSRARADYGNNFDRLERIRGEWDPGNVFGAAGHTGPDGWDALSSHSIYW